MQPIQTPILSRRIITPGDMPIFIVAPDMKRGIKLSMLLSANVSAPKSFARIYDDITSHNNYFFNSTVKKSLQGAAFSGYAKATESRQQLSLLLEESMSNGKLWGIQCTLEHFFRLELYSLYKDALYLFLYDDVDKLITDDIPFFRQMLDFSQVHLSNALIVHSKSVNHLADYLLSSLPFRYHAQPYTLRFSGVDEAHDEHEEKMKDMNVKATKQPIMKANGNPLAYTVIEESDKLNLFSKTNSFLTGNNVLIILRYEKDVFESVLRNKLDDVFQTFIYAPELYIVCNNEKDKLQIEAVLNDKEYPTLKANIVVSNHTIVVINEIIQNHYRRMIVVDGLHYNTSFANMIVPFDHAETSPTITFGKTISKTKQIGSLKLRDLLSTDIIQNTIAFPYLIWEKLGGFDSSLHESVYLWDFLINAVHDTDGSAVPIDASAAQGVETSVASKALMQSPAYQQVIGKHEYLFEQNFVELLTLLTEQQHLPQHEIKDLHHRISTLQSLMVHSQNELKAITDFTNALQQRINVLEGRWHYKLAAKVKRIKKIFFKKNTSGAGRLKKMLYFLAFTMSKPGLKIMRRISKNGLKKMYLLAEDRPVQISYLDEPSSEIRTYHDWINVQQNTEKVRKHFEADRVNFKLQPKISIVMPVYNPPLKYLKQAIESVIQQDYKNWELCISDDCSPGEKVQKILKVYALKDNRIKVDFRKENGHISACSNSALALATGDFVLLMDHDDLLSIDCLYEVVKHLNLKPEDDVIYSDEDKIDDANKHSVPHFKPDWAPDSLLSRNYFGHVVVIRKNIMEQIGGFRLGFEGSQDYDLILRATEVTSKIGHIPKVLYHWRIHGKSAAHSEEVKPYAYIAAKKALEEALQRRGTPGSVSYLSGLRGYRVQYDMVSPGKVSIIIPTKDHVKLLKNTIDSIFHLTDYTDYEIIVLNNNSTGKDFFSLMANYTAKYPYKFRCIDANFPFNFSKLMNIGRKEATGDYLLLMNNDMEVIHEDWLRRMVSYAQQKHIGAVGVKLLYPDDHIQHAGVAIGLGGVAGHVFVNAFKDDAGYFNYIQSVNNFSALTAACLMCRTALYDEVGGMNEDFEVEYNDVDLCLRFVNAGYYNVYLPDVELYHYESATRGHPHQSKESWERHIREIKLFKAAWQKFIDHDPHFNPNLNRGAHDFSMDFSAGIDKAKKTSTDVDEDGA